MRASTVKEPGNPAEKKRLSDAGLATLTIVLATSGALFALAVPRPVAPDETPGLALSAALVADALERDRALAAREETAAEAEVRAMLEAQSRAEVEGLPESSVRARQMQTVAAVTALTDAEGAEGLDTVRARAAERLSAALGLQGDEADQMDAEARTLATGRFESMLERYGLVVDGTRVAPPIVVRTLFKARVNAALYLPLTDGFSEVEQEAYWGWLAFEAEGVPPDRRLAALDELEHGTGRAHPEARGTLLFLAGDYAAAGEALERAYVETGSIRLRNHALAAVESSIE